MGAGGSTQATKKHDRRSRGSRDSEDTGSTASAFGRGDRERCLLHAQAIDKHSQLLPDHARLELEALISTLAHGRVYDVTAFLSQHPAGDRSILKHAGTDSTIDFDFHPHHAQKLWAPYMLGYVEGQDKMCMIQ